MLTWIRVFAISSKHVYGGHMVFKPKQRALSNCTLRKPPGIQQDELMGSVWD